MQPSPELLAEHKETVASFRRQLLDELQRFEDGNVWQASANFHQMADLVQRWGGVTWNYTWPSPEDPTYWRVVSSDLMRAVVKTLLDNNRQPGQRKKGWGVDCRRATVLMGFRSFMMDIRRMCDGLAAGDEATPFTAKEFYAGASMRVNSIEEAEKWLAASPKWITDKAIWDAIFAVESQHALRVKEAFCIGGLSKFRQFQDSLTKGRRIYPETSPAAFKRKHAI